MKLFHRTLLALAFGLGTVAGASAQRDLDLSQLGRDGRPVALINARVLTLAAPGEDGAAPEAVIPDGIVLLRDGRIEAVGRDLDIPPGAHIVDLAGGTVMPGLVHVWSTTGVQSSGGGSPMQLPANIPPEIRRRIRSSRSGGNNRPVMEASKTLSSLIYGRDPEFGELLAMGVTTLIAHPEGGGFPGLAAQVDPGAADPSAIVLDDDTYVLVAPQNTAAVGKLLKDSFEKAQKAVEERNKPAPKPEPKPAEKPGEGEKPKDGDKPKDGEKPAEGEKPKDGEKPKEGEKPAEGEKPQEQAKPKPKPAEKPKPKDPNIEVLADLLEGKRRAFVTLSTATDVLHYEYALKDLEKLDFPKVVVATSPSASSGLLEQVLDKVKAMDATVLMPPRLTTLPNTRTLVNSAADLHAAGITVGFLLPDSERGLDDLWFQLMELVRCGLPADAALAGVTRIPAEAAGLDAETGTLEEGKRADLLVFSGDPLDPTSRLLHVFHGGQRVTEEAPR